MNNFSDWAFLLLAALSAICLAGCASLPGSPARVTKTPFGKTTDGTPVDIYTLRNARGSEARISNYGGIVTSLKVPDKTGKLGDVVFGYDHLDGYLKSTPYFGCLVGRYGNRIARGKFTASASARKVIVGRWLFRKSSFAARSSLKCLRRKSTYIRG